MATTYSRNTMSHPESQPITATSAEATNPFATLDDFIGLDRVNAVVAKHGRHIATAAKLTEKKDRWSSFLVDLNAPADGTAPEPRRITRSVKGESLLAIGERGELYFTSGRTDDAGNDDESAVWMLPPHGEARVVLRRAGGINSLTVAGDRVYVTADVFPRSTSEEHNAETAKTRKERGMSAILHESFPVRRWDHDLGPSYPALFTGTLPSLYGEDLIELERVEFPESIPAGGRLHDVVVSPDGSRVAVALTYPHTTRYENYGAVYEIKPEPRLVVEGSVPEQTEFAPAAYNPSGTQLLLYSGFGGKQGAPIRNWLESFDVATGERTHLVPGFADWPKETIWIDDDTVAFTADRRGRSSIYVASLTDEKLRLLTNDDEAYAHISLTADGKIAALQEGIATAPRPVVVDLAGTVTIQEIFAQPELPGYLDEVTAQGEDGTDVRAWLALPHGTDSTNPAELLVFIHGGPWGSWNAWTWRWNPWVFVARGYAVLLPDPAISTGYGQNMIDRGSDAIGDAPFTDLLALIDAAEARTDINSEKTAVLGGSYGGYMANWFAGHTGTRFSCIVSHASLWDTSMMGRTTDNGVWYDWMIEQPEYSPHQFVKEIRTPMLIIHGDRDYRVPVGQSQALWFQLLHDSPVDGHKFLYFPDENHWVLKPSNSVLWYETVLAFLDTHIHGADFERPELLG